jgi:hypothetical protein
VALTLHQIEALAIIAGMLAKVGMIGELFGFFLGGMSNVENFEKRRSALGERTAAPPTSWR